MSSVKTGFQVSSPVVRSVPVAVKPPASTAPPTQGGKVPTPPVPGPQPAGGAWQQRQIRANGLAITRLTANDLTIVPEDPGFALLEAQIMGTAATASDGWHLVFDPAVSALIDDPPLFSDLDGELVNAGFVPGEIHNTMLVPIANDFAALVQTGDQQFSEYDGIVNAPGPAPPPSGPQPPPAKPPTQGDFPGITCKTMKALNPRLVHDAQPSEVYVSADTRATVATLVLGDHSLWSLRFQDQSSELGPLHNVILSCNLSKAGHFAASVKLQLAGWPAPQTFCYTIDIG